VLSAIYIKGFKTFARPVRMPLEVGVTAIVGPNGSGKSNITDAVHFALGEQSPGVLRAGALSELIFSGSETLPAAGAAEVTLVFDNGSGAISLPYEEVSVTRRISRAGETEYKINGTRARLQDVRAVAGEARIGRHSILRQGAVDAIVAGGAAACRLALEEAAGLGVFRRRRLSASRRLERADVQLEKSRQLETELAHQLKRIEREAAAAREYRELEARYRELSLAHLYRVATQETEELRHRLKDGKLRVEDMAEREEKLRREEEALARRSHELEGSLRELEERLEALEDGAEALRTESLRAERTLYRLEIGRVTEADRRRSVSRLEDELRRVSQAMMNLEEQVAELETEHSERREEAARLGRVLAQAGELRAAAVRERSRVAGNLESLRVRLASEGNAGERDFLSEEELTYLAAVAKSLEYSLSSDVRASLEEVRERLEEKVALVEAGAEETSRRRGTLAAAIGRAESRIRALQGKTSNRAGTRLYEVIRARPGYEVAVEAALGEFGAGVLAENVDVGMRLLSTTERVAVRLDARRIDVDEIPPGKPLVECVDIVDARYAEALERLLGGIYVIDDPENNAPANGYIAVTREGLRLTRRSVSFRPGGNGFAREARLSTELERLDTLKKGPGEILYHLQAKVSEASSRLEKLTTEVQRAASLADRTSRAGALLAREATRRMVAAEATRKDFLRQERVVASLTQEVQETEAALAEAEKALTNAEAEITAALSEAEAARAAAADSDRGLVRLHTTLDDGQDRHAKLSVELERLRETCAHETGRTAQIADRAAQVSRRLVAAAQDRRNAMRTLRSQTAHAHRYASAERTSLTQRAADLARSQASASADVERLAEELRRAEDSAVEAAEELSIEWGATLEAARQEAERHPPKADIERGPLARKLKRFGDVNLLALSQERELRERHQFVAAQRADAEAAANELNRIIMSIDREIERRFSETFERVRDEFGEMVPRMIEGASGDLGLSEEGVAIGLRLGRRGWKPLRVLSGGERALLALSFLFSIFLSRGEGRSGAFCMLDEAEAALDDINLARFLAVVDSHRANGQYLLVTHQKRTMAAADVLYGVIQDASGATTVVSKRMQGE
jgi:chromosome segregation protein